jgi:RNA polymerase sigma-70 factor (ECF subfamily)
LARSYYDAGKTGWPAVHLEFSVFHAYFERHRAGGASPDPKYAADMVLACACAEGIRAALLALEGHLLPEVVRGIDARDRSRAFGQEAVQILRERVLVRRGNRAKIADYAGRSSLLTWLRSVAVRITATERRRRGDQLAGDHEFREEAPSPDRGPDAAYVRSRYRPAFERAVRSATARLPHKQRLLLRLHVSNGVGIDKLAAMFGVGRSTVARWIVDARAALRSETHKELRTSLRLSARELESLAADLQSELDVSFAGLLTTTVA